MSSSSALTSVAHLSGRANNSNAPKPSSSSSSSSKSRHQKGRSARFCDRRIWITTTTTYASLNSNNTNDIINKNNKSSSLSSFGGSSVLEDFDGQKPEIGSTMTRSSTTTTTTSTYFGGGGGVGGNPLRGAKSRAENAMRARQFTTSRNQQYANGGSAAYGSMVPDEEEASTSGQQTQQLEQEKEEQMSDIKKRMMVALECERQDLADGSVLFRFSEKPLTRQQKAALAAEEKKIQISSSDFERQPNFIERWFMTVRFQAATVSVEKAFLFVLSTPFRMAFWTFAYAMRFLFWIVTGRFNLLFSLNKGKRRASKQLAASYSQMEIEKQRKEKMERERAFLEGSAKVARERLKL
jgi:hypothetical protein